MHVVTLAMLDRVTFNECVCQGVIQSQLNARVQIGYGSSMISKHILTGSPPLSDPGIAGFHGS